MIQRDHVELRPEQVAIPPGHAWNRLPIVGAGLAGLEGRESRQLSQGEKASRATHVLSNAGTLAELDERVVELVDELEGTGGV